MEQIREPDESTIDESFIFDTEGEWWEYED
jgi:hypothetical protein